jgi:hypothetical protein
MGTADVVVAIVSLLRSERCRPVSFLAWRATLHKCELVATGFSSLERVARESARST